VEFILQYLDDIDDLVGAFGLIVERLRRLALFLISVLLLLTAAGAGMWLAFAHPPIALATSTVLFVTLLYRSVTAPKVPPPTLALSASKVSLPGDGTPVSGGDTITYALILEVSNGPTTADVVLTDTLGPGLTFGSITDNPDGFVAGGSGNNRTFTLPGSVAPGTYMVEYTATVNLDATGTTVNNYVLIVGGGDPDPEETFHT